MEGIHERVASDQSANGIVVFCKLHKTRELHIGPKFVIRTMKLIKNERLYWELKRIKGSM